MLALKHLEADNPDTRSSLGSVIWQLIDQTDNINAAEIRTGSTALHIAIESLKKGRINPEVISQLVKRPQIDLLQKNSTGQTPYKLAKEQIIASAVVDFLFQWNYYQKSTKASKHKSEVINILREQTNASEEIIQLIGEYACKTYPITTPPKNINPHLS